MLKKVASLFTWFIEIYFSVSCLFFSSIIQFLNDALIFLADISFVVFLRS